MADKKPYFFRYKYKQLSKDYNAYIKKTDQNAAVHLCTSLKELLEKEKLEQQGKATLTEEEKTFLFYYRKNLPVIDSDCVMNKICKYIESIDFHIKQKIKSKQDFDYKILLSENGFQINQKLYKEIKAVVEDFMKSWHSSIKSKEIDSDEKLQVQGLDQNKVDRDIKLQNLKYDLNSITSNEEQLCNHLVYLFYVDKPSYSKSTLWNICGREIYNNILKRTSVVYYPVKDDNGDIEFMYSKYSVKHVSTESLKKPEAYVYNNYSLGQEIFEDKDGEENYQFDKCFMILPKPSEDFSFKKIIYTTKGENPDD